MSTTVSRQDGHHPDDPIATLAKATPVESSASQFQLVAIALNTQLIDPILARIRMCLDRVEATLRHAATPPEAYLSSESGEALADKVAKAKVDHNQAGIAGRQAAGSSIDVAAPTWLLVAGKLAPFVESLGILVYITFLWNVDWLRPWEDLLSFITAVVLVTFMPLLQKHFAEAAGRAHNEYRLNLQSGLDDAASAGRLRRDWHLGAALLIASIVTATIVIRGLIALDAPLWYESAIVSLLAGAVGLGTAVLAYAAVALNGTRYSRENAELLVQGDTHAAEWEADIGEAEEGLEQASNDERELIESAFPKVLETVRTQFEGNPVEEPHNLQPLVERAKRVMALRQRRDELVARLAEVKQNPPAFRLNS